MMRAGAVPARRRQGTAQRLRYVENKKPLRSMTVPYRIAGDELSSGKLSLAIIMRPV